MNVLIFGAGNVLLCDEGFGVHCVRRLERDYEFPTNVRLLDAGTMGMLLTPEIEMADRVYILDVVEGGGQPGDVLRYEKEHLLLDCLPVKLSPHQMGVQEMLLVSELRGKCPDNITLLGIVTRTVEPGDTLSPECATAMKWVIQLLVTELGSIGLAPRRRNVSSRPSLVWNFP